jgi:hypothetical protein
VTNNSEEEKHREKKRWKNNKHTIRRKHRKTDTWKNK